MIWLKGLVCWLEHDVLFRESHVTFFMEAIMGKGVQLVLSAEPRWGKARKCEKINGEYKMVPQWVGTST